MGVMLAAIGSLLGSALLIDTNVFFKLLNRRHHGAPQRLELSGAAGAHTMCSKYSTR